MQPLKNLKTIHDHSLTDWLKWIIFAIMMLAPFFAIVIECLYLICNKNAPSNYNGVQQDLFYNAVANMCNKPLFNWTTDTGIYTTINAMCSGLQIENGALPILLTYWSFITLIYIVFDLVIGIFTKITHLLK